MTNDKPISVTYSDAKLRLLVEEYITQQRSTFTLKGACSYVLYWAMEDGNTDKGGQVIYESAQMSPSDCDRVRVILEEIVHEGRLSATNDEVFKKIAV